MDDIRFFNRFAALYDYIMPEADIENISTIFYQNDHREPIIELGGGTGRVATKFRSSPIVLDASIGMLQQAQHKGLECILADVSKLPICSDKVEGFLIVDAFHHFPDPLSNLSQFYELLPKDGILVIQEFNPATIRGRLLTVSEHLMRFESTFFTPEELISNLQNVGFQVSKISDGFSYTLVAEKPQ
ncbi:MAG: class I SAM-dependent methyltransferase [Halobacteriaceae archaeon]